MKKTFIVLLALILVTSLVTGCKKKKVIVEEKERITLTYYKLFENEENLEAVFAKFQAKYPHIQINYKKFIDPERYIETLVDELAEGGGPDIMSVPNTWVRQNYKKLVPAPNSVVSVQAYKDTLVDIAAKDNILTDSEGNELVYGIPLSVDSLALFYNDSHFEEVIPERGKPSATWTGIEQDVQRLSKRNTATLDRFDRAAIALGRSDNISRAADIFILMLIQNGIEFYDNRFLNAKFASNLETDEVLNFILSFADEESQNYSWNKFVADENSNEKELTPFVTGKTSMIFGYSHLYKDILNQIKVESNNGKDTIKANDVKVTEIPQVSLDGEKVAFARYFTETVSRNSVHSEEAWLLLTHMIEKDNLEKWYKKDFKPTSRRDLIPSQRNNPIYAAFVNQIGYSKTLPMIDIFKYEKIFNTLIERAAGEEFKRNELNSAQQKINQLIPNEGAYPIPQAE